MQGLVFVSYARGDAARVQALIACLPRTVNVWWDRDILPGEPFRDAIWQVLDKASCVLVVWSRASIGRDFVRAEAERGYRRGVLIPVLLDANLEIPLRFGEIQGIDLSKWTGGKSEALHQLVERVRVLAQRKTYSSNYAGRLTEGAGPSSARSTVPRNCRPW